jgi:hypothetical protein
MEKYKAASKLHQDNKIDKFSSGRHSDEAADRKLVKEMVKPSSLERARGGAATPKGKTQINVIVAPGRGTDRPSPVPVPVKAVPAGASAGSPPLRQRFPVGAKAGGAILKGEGSGSGEGRLNKNRHYAKKS